MRIKRVTKNQLRKLIFIPDDQFEIYMWQEDTLHNKRIADIKKYHYKKSRFINSEKGQAMLKCKLKKTGEIHEIDVWIVDGHRLRSGHQQGDVDFTMGGHGYRYLYIPKHEIWIDQIYYKTKDYWPIVWHEYIERILMRNGLPYNNSHDIASALEIVHRDDDFFVLPIGTHRQNHAWTCGPASLKIVMDYLRYPVSESYLTRLTKCSRKKGTDPENMIAAARKMRFVAEDMRGLKPKLVKKMIRAGIPVIANYQLEPAIGEGHYAVIIGFSENEYVLSNPALDKGYEVVPIKEFQKNWYELEDNTVKQGIIIKNEE
ncbi:MAG: cysteine peptidase family C39 domain-containing protein [Patescibacteria group bacterium]